jgi:uncharacterized coiled-coil DUF342 family protein
LLCAVWQAAALKLSTGGAESLGQLIDTVQEQVANAPERINELQDTQRELVNAVRNLHAQADEQHKRMGEYRERVAQAEARWSVRSRRQTYRDTAAAAAAYSLEWHHTHVHPVWLYALSAARK